MRQGYKISLFFVCMIVLILIALILMKRHGLYQFDEEKPYIEEIREEPDVTQVQNSDIKTTCDTLCLYEDFDKKDGSVSYRESKIQGKYIGMNRAQLEKALWDDSKILSLEDKEKGFESQHLELFSKERVKIVRIYDTTPQASGYYIMAVDHEIWIYQSDRTTLYFKTGIKLSQLPETVQREVMQGKYMDSELAIYHFLESYSS